MPARVQYYRLNPARRSQVLGPTNRPHFQKADFKAFLENREEALDDANESEVHESRCRFGAVCSSAVRFSGRPLLLRGVTRTPCPVLLFFRSVGSRGQRRKLLE
jgi:hypothetical protein